MTKRDRMIWAAKIRLGSSCEIRYNKQDLGVGVFVCDGYIIGRWIRLVDSNRPAGRPWQLVTPLAVQIGSSPQIAQVATELNTQWMLDCLEND